MKKILMIISIVFCSHLGYALDYSWTAQTSGTTNTLFSVYFTDANTGYVVGDKGTILKTTNGGTTWSAQTSGTTNLLYSVYFINGNTGWAVGYNATILKTTNGGTTWIAQSSGIPYACSLTSVYFIDANTGYAVSGNGYIIKTTDGGSTWNRLTSGTSGSLNSVYFTDANTGYIAGCTSTANIALKTTDGGTTWNALTNGTSGAGLFSVYFTDSNTGYTVGLDNSSKASILKTTDAGATWSAQSTGGKLSPLRSVKFIDSNNGFTTGDQGLTLKTTNGGATWTDICDPVYGPFGDPNSPGGKSNTMLSIFFINANTGWEVGGNGIILKYNNLNPTIVLGGNPSVCSGTTTANLTYSSPTNSPDHYSITYSAASHSAGFVDVTNAILPTSPIILVVPNTASVGTYTGSLTVSNNVTGNVSASYPISITVNGSPTITLGANPEVCACAMSVSLTYNSSTNNPDHYSITYSTAAHLAGFVDITNATLTSSPISLPFPTGAAAAIYTGNLIVTNSNTTCSSGSSTFNIGVNTINTTNWITQTSGTTNTLFSVYFTDANTGYVVGDKGTILKTTNGGTTWSAQTSGTTNLLYSVYFINGNTGWAVGYNATILKTTNGGTTWIAQSSGIPYACSLTSVYFIDANTGYAVSGNGYIIKTTDGGSTWNRLTSGTSGSLNSVYFTDANTGYIAGCTSTANIALKTTDGGTTWNALTNGTSGAGLFSVYFTDSNTGYTVGLDNSSKASILKTTDAGATWSAQSTGGKLSPLRSVKFIDSNNGFTTGDQGLTLKTTNGGATWTDICDPVYGPFGDPNSPGGKSNTMLSIFFINANTGWEVGGNGIILKYTNPCPTINLGSNPSVNSGTTSANLAYSSTTNNPNNYSITYSAASHSAGFVDVTNATLSSPIILTVPSAVTPATYTGNLNVANNASGYKSGAYPISVTIKYDSLTITALKNSRIFSRPDAVNNILNDYPYLVAEAWTWNGVFGIMRILIKFDLSTIPTNAIINSATFNLMGSGHNPLTHSNSSSFKLVTKAWDYTNATWTNMNNYYSNTGSISIPGTTSTNQNATVNLSSFVQNWVSNPLTNYGMMFMLDNETTYAEMQYGSDDNTVTTLRPSLNITYAFSSTKSALGGIDVSGEVQPNLITPVGNSSDSTLFDNNIIVSPIPANNFVNVEISANGTEKVGYEIYNSEGLKVSQGRVSFNQNEKIDIESLKQGVYYILFKYNNNAVTKKFVIIR